MAGPTNTNPPGFKGDPSSGGRKGGVISSTGIDPTASDRLVKNAESGGAPSPGQPAPGPQGGAQPQQAQSFFDEPGDGFGMGQAEPEPLLPDDPDARIRALYRKFPNEDLRRLLEFRDRG